MAHGKSLELRKISKGTARIVDLPANPNESGNREFRRKFRKQLAMIKKAVGGDTDATQ